MAFIYGLLKNHSAPGENNQLHALSEKLKWPGAVEYPFQYESLSGGIVMHRAFGTDVHRFLYTGHREQVLVLLSGSFYNRQELLVLANSKNGSIPDPELAWLLFSRYGKDFVKYINGDFAIIVYQPAAGTLHLYRDHLGMRPLSWTVSDRSFWFASDGVELCRALHSNRKINPAYLQRFLVHGDIADLSLLPDAEVKKLLPGTFLEVSAGMKCVANRYWFPEKIKENKLLDFDTAKGELAELIKNAVAIRSDTGLRAATHLSGGLDSGIIAALARQEYAHQHSFKGFSWSPPPAELPYIVSDERKLVEETGKKCNLEPVYLKLDVNDLQDFYDDWRLPGKSFHETALRKRMRGENINLLFSGWGGDEFVSLNNRGVDSDLLFKLQWRLYFKRHSIRRPVRVLKSVIGNVLLPASGIDFWLHGQVRCRYMKVNRPFYHLRLSPLYKWRSRRDVHLALLNFGHIGERAEQWFPDGYREGIEYRYPLCDKRIVEYMLTVPTPVLCKNNRDRLLLREISLGILPDMVVWWKDKSNPAMAEIIRRVYLKVYAESIAELEEIKRNPDLVFVNFDALERDIFDKGGFLPDDEIPAHAVFLLMLKHLHRFTMEYYRQ